MAEETEKAVQEEHKQIKIEVKETSVPSVYVNTAQFSRTEWDVRIDLGEQHSVDPETSTMLVIPKLRLLMTPDFAERFLEIFARTIERWKQQAEEQAKAKAEETKTTKEPPK